MTTIPIEQNVSEKQYPKIILKYSAGYDRQWSLALNKNFDKEASENKFKIFIENLKKYWTEEKEAKAMQLIAKYSGLDWKADAIWVYFVNNLNISGFSSPLTIRISDDYPDICHTIIHESIHNILFQNDEKVKPAIEHLNSAFPNEDKNTILHIIVNAIDRRVFSETFGEENFRASFEKIKNYKGLKRAYDILEDVYPKLGENILESLMKI